MKLCLGELCVMKAPIGAIQRSRTVDVAEVIFHLLLGDGRLAHLDQATDDGVSDTSLDRSVLFVLHEG